MTDHQCESCSYESDDLDEFQRHLQEMGHASICKDEASAVEGKLIKALVVAEVLTATALGVAVWMCKHLYSKLEESEAENNYLKSPSGAGANLKNHHKR
ncbi:hypothetical protein OG229_13950 [Streptomyces platensis]|uniref:hypothetical protein n=1 Tax=Streptomyces platensis TaxID=58346 RepID=UPI002E149C5F|nr:hypothetical protein OG229_13950 [Streptomyces platensis]